MGKIKNKTGLKNRDALEFVLVNRGMDDPNYNNPEATPKILLHVPKEEGDLNKEHEKIMSQIPEMNRGVYTEQAVQNTLKELGIENLHGDMDYKELKSNLNEINKENFIKKVNLDLTKTDVVQFQKNSKIKTQTEEEEVVDTSSKPLNKPDSIKLKDELDDKKVDEILKNAKISADITEYNKFGLRKDIDPEVLNFITDKEFVEGVDIFIPAPNGLVIDKNRYDIDIQPEKMNEEYKEVYEAMKSEDEDNGEELEDNFILLANEGILPIQLNKHNMKEDQDEAVIMETRNKNKNPSYKYITKEEKELLDKQFDKTIKEYNNFEGNKAKGNYVPKEIMEQAMDELIGAKKANGKSTYRGLTAKYEDEEEFEDYEYDEEENMDELEEGDDVEEVEVDCEDIEKSENEDNKDEEKDKIEFCANNFKIEYENKKIQDKKGKKKKNVPLSKRNDIELFTIEDLNRMVHDKNFIESTINIIESKTEEDKIEELQINYAKKRLDITSVHGKIGHLPKTVGEPNVKLPRNANRDLNITTHTQEGSHNNGKSIVLSSNKPILPITPGLETNEQKKLRKKLVKEEHKEKRKQKKELKTAFQSEKSKLQKQIADTNQHIRYGLSVKEI